MLLRNLLVFVLVLLISVSPVACYDCWFGYSTGHCGTTTLSSPHSYENVSDVGFGFEGKYGGTNMQIPTHEYREFTSVDDELQWVKNVLAPNLYQSLENTKKKVYVDFGHHSLYFYRGLALYLLEKDPMFCSTLHIVRIRRERYELAQSLMYIRESEKQKSLSQMVYRFVPAERKQDVLLPPPVDSSGNSVFQKLTTYQQMLWFIDETEARWLQFKLNYQHISGLELHEVSWTNADNSMPGVVKQISHWLGGHPSMKIHQLKKHAGDLTVNKAYGKNADMDYWRMMNFTE